MPGTVARVTSRARARDAYYLCTRAVRLSLLLSLPFAVFLTLSRSGCYFEAERTYLPACNDSGAAGKANFQPASPFRPLPLK